MQLIANIAIFDQRIIKIIGIIFISRVLFEIVYLLIEEVLFKEQNLTEIQRSRSLTLVSLLRSFLQYLIYLGTTVFILYTVGIDPDPILVGTGIAGIVVGLGAQTLINDFVCCFLFSKSQICKVTY
ncbi:hypothetical protein [Nostoc sp.]|uniref:hypothetical protein n=1 Tax=Nostoc sp. TaxID=1180 RepID=UPI002FFB91CD